MINSSKSHLRVASTTTDPVSHDATMIGFFLPKRSGVTMAARWRGWAAAVKAVRVGTGQQASTTHLANKRQATAVGFETQLLQWTTGASHPLFGSPFGKLSSSTIRSKHHQRRTAISILFKAAPNQQQRLSNSAMTKRPSITKSAWPTSSPKSPSPGKRAAIVTNDPSNPSGHQRPSNSDQTAAATGDFPNPKIPLRNDE
ncbi:hypothetical protein ACLOJK_036702 [Asimina triloba]